MKASAFLGQSMMGEHDGWTCHLTKYAEYL